MCNLFVTEVICNVQARVLHTRQSHCAVCATRRLPPCSHSFETETCRWLNATKEKFMSSGLQNMLVVTNNGILQKILDTSKANNNVCPWGYGMPPLYENRLKSCRASKRACRTSQAPRKDRILKPIPAAYQLPQTEVAQACQVMFALQLTNPRHLLCCSLCCIVQKCLRFWESEPSSPLLREARVSSKASQDGTAVP